MAATPTRDAFAYSSDIGVPSTSGIEALAHSSGVQFSVTSEYRDEAGSFHQTHNAADMASSTGSMVTLAAYLYQYSPYLLELIHSGGGGFYVKYGERVDSSYYGSTIVSQHYNHVHCAATMSGLQAASQGKFVIPDSAQLASAKGCIQPTVTAVIITLGGLTWMLDLLIR